MNASNHLTPTSRPSIKAIINSGHFKDDEFTIYVCERETTFGKTSKLFLTSSGIDETTENGVQRYTQDTGLGHKNKNKELTIQNVIHVKNGRIVKSTSNAGMSECRSIWVCK
jgi:hypothetical protein